MEGRKKHILFVKWKYAEAIKQRCAQESVAFWRPSYMYFFILKYFKFIFKFFKKSETNI
jgi:hypothetical protein